MKNTLFAIALILSTISYAQPKVSGLLGVNYSNLRVGYDPDTRWKFGFRGGLLVTGKHLMSETAYTTKGLLENRNQDPITRAYHNDRWRFNMNYIQQSLMFKVNLGQVYLHAGGYAAYLIDAKQYNVFYGVYKRYDNDDFRRFDYGLKGGINWEMGGGALHLSYERGARFIADDGMPHGDHATDHAFKHVGYNLSFSVPFANRNVAYMNDYTKR